MSQKTRIIIVAFMLSVIPLAASAGWFWNKQNKTVVEKNIIPAEKQIAELSAAGKETAEAKYKIVDACFSKKDVDCLMANQDNFWFTTTELNYLINTKSAKTKKPLVSDFNLSNENGYLVVSANAKKIIKGNISFNLKIEQENGKARLNLSKTKLFGFPVPGSWFSKPLTEALDKYLSFIYNDSRYQGFTFSNDNEIIKIRPEFK